MRELGFVEVVEKYQTLIDMAIGRIESHFGEVTLSRVRSGDSPSSGDLPDLTFYFHGIGCTAQIDGYTVNWDWNRAGETNEFEAWRLWQMTRDHADE